MSAIDQERTIILGIDPGSRVTGFGLIEATGERVGFIGAGHIKTGHASFAARLRKIFEDVGALVLEHRPDEIAIERVFMHRNADSALKLGHARAAAMCATFAASVPVFEYAAREVKQAVVGRGAADKSQVEHMVRILLGQRQRMQADAADALAIAICHANTRYTQRRLGKALEEVGR